jgi:hypothetical protein
MSPKDNNKQVSAAVRILHQKRDASARATHLKAENWIVQSSTIERKIMSTKTTFKRLALVTVAALGLGILSPVAANAGIGTPGLPVFLSATSSYSGAGTTGGTFAAPGANDAVSYTAGLVTGSVSAVTLPAGVSVVFIETATSSLFGTDDIFDLSINGIQMSTDTGTATLSRSLTAYTVPTTAGTYDAVITYYRTATTRAAATLTSTTNFKITVVAGNTISAGNTAAASFIDSGTAVAAEDGDVVFSKSVPAAFNSTSTGATLSVYVKSSSNAALVGQAITATVTGPGLISMQTGATTGTIGTVRSKSFTATEMASESAVTIGITADGTAGTSTITVSSGTTTLLTKTVIFYGTVATLTAVQNLSIAPAAGGSIGTASAAPAGTTVATTPAVTVVAKDSAGNIVPGLTVAAKSADTTVISGGSVAESSGAGAGDGYAGPGYYNFNATSALNTSGKSTTVTYRTLLADGVTYVTSNAVTFTLGGKASTATFTAALDKSSYSMGEAASLVISAKDTTGNPIFDQDVDLFGGSGTAPVWSKSVQGLAVAAGSIKFIGGKKTYTGYSPSLGGDFSMSGTADAVSLAGGAISASATVEGDASASLALDAANAATDAANNAYDEAQNATQAASDALAAVTALAAQVKSLIASVKKLTAAVAKLKK